jgi:RHS repeat-associated protein
VITDQNGDRKERIEYFPFGTYKEAVDYDPNFPDVFYTFTGQEDDDDLGLYNFKARLYDPSLGRFISPDIIDPNIDDPQSLNRYSYARNNPLIYIDPTGNQYESYDPNLWVSSIYGPLGSFGSSISQLGSFSITTGSNFSLNINTSSLNYVGNNPIFSINLSQGAQFSFKLGIFKFDINFGSDNYNFFTGERTVKEGFACGLLFGDKVVTGIKYEREVLDRQHFPNKIYSVVLLYLVRHMAMY